MTQPAFNSTSLSEGEMDLIQATAYVWRARGFERTADNLLTVAGFAAPAPLPANVYSLAAARARRQAVTR